VVDTLSPRPRTCAMNFVCERQFCPRKYTNCYVYILGRTEASSGKVEHTCGELVANLGWPGFDEVKAVVAHRGTPYVAPARLKLTLFAAVTLSSNAVRGYSG
jgi:hypothetical protein